jgi:linoleoyl-CoA desaturase
MSIKCERPTESALHDFRKIKFRAGNHAGFYRLLKQRVNAYFEESGRSRHADWRAWTKCALFAAIAAGSYCAILLTDHGPWQTLLLANLFGLSTLLLAINVAHDAAHDSLTGRPVVNRIIQIVIFMMLGADAYLWRLRHVKSHHTFPNVNGCDIDIDNTTFLRLSPNQPWRPYHRFQHLYAPLIFWLADVHTVFWQDFVYLRKRRLANMTDIHHPPHAYLLFVLGKLAYLTLILGIPIAMLPLPWWQVLLGVLIMTFVSSSAFVMLLIGTHFAEETLFPEHDREGYIPHDWAEHALVTSIDWSPTSVLATALAGGANAHAAHHLFPTVCHVHYRALTPIIERTAAEFGLTYNRTTLGHLIRSHFRFLWRMGRPPVEAPASLPASSRAPRGWSGLAPPDWMSTRLAGAIVSRVRRLFLSQWASGIARVLAGILILSGCAGNGQPAYCAQGYWERVALGNPMMLGPNLVASALLELTCDRDKEKTTTPPPSGTVTGEASMSGRRS